MRYGSTADLYNWSLAYVGIKFLSRISTPILWLVTLQVELTCSEKFNLESIVTPKSLIKGICTFNFLIVSTDHCFSAWVSFLSVADVQCLVFF